MADEIQRRLAGRRLRRPAVRRWLRLPAPGRGPGPRSAHWPSGSTSRSRRPRSRSPTSSAADTFRGCATRPTHASRLVALTKRGHAAVERGARAPRGARGPSLPSGSGRGASRPPAGCWKKWCAELGADAAVRGPGGCDRRDDRGVRRELAARADAAKAPDMQAYMKSDMPFSACKSPRGPSSRDRSSSRTLRQPRLARTRCSTVARGATYREERYLALAVARRPPLPRFARSARCPCTRS